METFVEKKNTAQFAEINKCSLDMGVDACLPSQWYMCTYL